MSQVRDKFYYAKKEGWVSLWANLFLFIIKFYAGIVSGSVALIADAWHTLSDSLSSLVVLVGAKISQKPADHDHPFGHGRAESVASIIIGVLLVLVGVNFAVEGVQRLMDRQDANYGTIAIVVTIISLVVKELLAQYAIRLGKRFKLYSLISDGWHHRSDSISSFVILVGIFLGSYWWWIDGVLGFLVGLMIVYTGVVIIRNTIQPLLGEHPSEDLVQSITALANQISEHNLHPHHFHIHKYGEHSEVTFHIRLPGEMILSKAHQITYDFRNILREKLGMEATIYLEPELPDLEKGNIIRFSGNDEKLLHRAIEIRKKVFVEEQGVDEQLEVDGKDKNCIHYLVHSKGNYYATARYRQTTDGIKLERFAVMKPFRNKKVGEVLLRFILDELSHQNQKVYLHAQDRAVNFYLRAGFEIRGDEFEEAGIKHFKMIYPVKQ